MDEGSLQNDITKAQEDETGFDLLNEETFGDVGTCKFSTQRSFMF